MGQRVVLEDVHKYITKEVVVLSASDFCLALDFVYCQEKCFFSVVARIEWGKKKKKKNRLNAQDFNSDRLIETLSSVFNVT